MRGWSGFTETFGGMFLALGLLSRLTALPLIINFIVAYITTEQDGLKDSPELRHRQVLRRHSLFPTAGDGYGSLDLRPGCLLASIT